MELVGGWELGSEVGQPQSPILHRGADSGDLGFSGGWREKRTGPESICAVGLCLSLWECDDVYVCVTVKDMALSGVCV